MSIYTDSFCFVFVIAVVYKSFVLNSEYSSLSTNIIGIPAEKEKAYLAQETWVWYSGPNH